MKIEFDLNNPKVVEKMRKTTFLDIETSLIDARVFSTGKQYIGIDQTSSKTKLLTVAGGTMYDLYTKGEAGVWATGNHLYDTFEADPLDDRGILEEIWEKLDQSDTIVCHNAKFDDGWIRGRFLQEGMPLPSPYKVVCTYRGLAGYSMNSKRLDYLSETLVGTNKLKTSWSLWDRCSDGEIEAFEEMLEYNKGDIYATLFQIYLRTAAYYPKKCVDLSVSGELTCRVTGYPLDIDGVMEKNGLEYLVYKDQKHNIYYRDRYNCNSKKSGKGYTVPL